MAEDMVFENGQISKLEELVTWP